MFVLKTFQNCAKLGKQPKFVQKKPQNCAKLGKQPNFVQKKPQNCAKLSKQSKFVQKTSQNCAKLRLIEYLKCKFYSHYIRFGYLAAPEDTHIEQISAYAVTHFKVRFHCAGEQEIAVEFLSCNVFYIFE